MVVTARKLSAAFTVLTGAASIGLSVGLAVLGSFNITFTHNFNRPFVEFGLGSAAASTPFQYNPPNRGTPKTTVGTGSRGCTQSAPVTLTLLVPNDHTGETISGHPSLFWYASDPISTPVEVALVEPGVVKPLFVRQISGSRAGIVQTELPADAPELIPGRKYRWSVSLICNANRPSSDVFVQSWVKRVSMKPELAKELADSTSTKETSAQKLSDRAQIFARAGLWYDALAAISAAYSADRQNTSVVEARLSLLDRVGLTQVAAQERKRLALQSSLK